MLTFYFYSRHTNIDIFLFLTRFLVQNLKGKKPTKNRVGDESDVQLHLAPFLEKIENDIL